MFWIDAHAHISFFNDETIQQILEKSYSQNLRYWILAGYDSQDWQRQIQIKTQNPASFATAFGLHPWRVLTMSQEEVEADIKKLEQLLPQAQALGETGIDKFKTTDDLQVQYQTTIFERHLEMNKDYNLPLVLHLVRAENEALPILKKYSYTGVVHGFSGSYETAKRFIDLGYKISIGRGVYAKGYKQLKECVQRLSQEDFVIESDAGLDEHGRPEDPLSVYFQVANSIAELKSLRVEDLLSTNFANVKKVFRI